MRILVCPLDWGLGHATRCIPLIRELQNQGARVIIASEGRQLELLKNEFPQAEFIPFTGYRVRYAKKTGVALSLITKIPKLAFRIFSEHQQLKKLIREYRIDGLISDNRYGLWNRKIYSIFITHQLNIIAPAPFKPIEPLLHFLIRLFINKFNECWIPDTSHNNNLSGNLSRNPTNNSHFIGLISRFDLQPVPSQAYCYDLVALVSGPEPQREILEAILLDQLPVENKRCLLLRGLPGEDHLVNMKKNLDIANHLPTSTLHSILALKPIVISRSGYSTLMDLAFTGNKAIIVPTPGQTEQEYLAQRLEIDPNYFVTNQQELNLAEAVSALDQFEIAVQNPALKIYPDYISAFLKKLNRDTIG